MTPASRGTDSHGKAQGSTHGGGHGWFVTFADLMGLLVSFFVMLVAFSNQDQNKLQIVAGSMRDAFGVQTNVRYSGIIEVDGSADPAEAQERRPYRARGRLGHADAGRARPQARLRRQASRTTRPSRSPRHRCAKRCRTCRS